MYTSKEVPFKQATQEDASDNHMASQRINISTSSCLCMFATNEYCFWIDNKKCKQCRKYAYLANGVPMIFHTLPRETRELRSNAKQKNYT